MTNEIIIKNNEGTMRHSRAECLKQGTDTRVLDENGKPKTFSLDAIMVYSPLLQMSAIVMNRIFVDQGRSPKAYWRMVRDSDAE